MPLAVNFPPIARRFPFFVANNSISVHQPQRRRAVAAVFHERHPLGIRDEMALKSYRADQRAMCGLFVIKVESMTGMSDGMDALVECDPFVAAARRFRKFPVGIVSRGNR